MMNLTTTTKILFDTYHVIVIEIIAIEDLKVSLRKDNLHSSLVLYKEYLIKLNLIKYNN